MRLSLKEFFLHEDEGKKSSTNITINVEGVEAELSPLGDWAATVWALASRAGASSGPRRQALGRHLASRGKSAHDARQPPEDFLKQFLRQGAEGLQLEYEDPTDSRHDAGDSKWADPFSPKERMPHEVPQDHAQSHSADGWGDTRCDGPEGHGAPQNDLRAFFGGAPYPKRKAEGMAEADDKGKLPDELPDDWFKDLEGGGKPAPPPPKQPAAPAGPLPDELPSDWFKDLGNKPPEASPGGEEGVLDYSKLDPNMSDDDFMDMLGKAKRVINVPPSKREPTPAMRQVMNMPSPPPAAPPEWSQGERSAQHAGLRPGDEEGGERYDFQGDVGWHGPDADPLSSSPSESDMTWDELRASKPRMAASLEREFGGDPGLLQGSTFRWSPHGHEQGGWPLMLTPDKRRFTHLGKDIGWADMDDGGTPAGEF